eukprot:jgi/Mesvir1/14582/Mv05258-RA.2
MGPAPLAPLVAKRLCLMLGAIASHSGPPLMLQFVTQALALAQAHLGPAAAAAHAATPESRTSLAATTLSMELLEALAMEAETMDRSRRQPLVAAMATRAVEVLAMVQAVLSQLGGGSTPGAPGDLSSATGGSSHTVGCRCGALRCLLAWLKLEYSGGGSSLLTAGQMYAGQPALFTLVVALLGEDNGDLFAASVDVLVELLTPGAGTRADPATEDAAALEVSRRVVAQGWRLSPEGTHHPSSATLPTGRTTATGQGAVLSSMGGTMGGHSGGGGQKIELEVLAMGLSRVALAIAESCTELLASGNPDTLALTELVLRCACLEDTGVVEVAVDYFAALNTVPVAARPHHLQGPLYVRLLQHALLRHAMYPEGFTCWAEHVGDMDEDSFHRFREQVLTDILDTAYGLLRSQYLQYITAALQAATNWQATEAALFAVRCVSISVKSRVLPERVSEGVDPAIAADCEESNKLLSGLFQRIAQAGIGGGRMGDAHAGVGGMGSPGVVPGVPSFSSPGVLVASASRLIGAYASWFGNCSGAFVEGVLAYLLNAMQVPDAWSQAASAFRSLCARCCAHLRDEALLSRLISSLHEQLATQHQHHQQQQQSHGQGRAHGSSASSSGAMPLDDKVALVEGLARVVASLPANQAVAMAQRLASPFTARIAQLAAVPPSGSVSPAQAAALAEELAQFGAVLRFLEFNTVRAAAEHPAMAVMQAAWPLLEQVAGTPAWRSQPDVIAHLCGAYTNVVLSCKGFAVPLAPPMLQALVALVADGQHAPCLGAIGTMVEIFAPAIEEEGGGGAQQSQRTGDSAAGGEVWPHPRLPGSLFDSVAQQVCGVVFSYLQGVDLARHDELLRALFDMAHRYLLFRPASILSLPSFPVILVLASACVRLKERDPVRAALVFLAYLLAPPDKQLRCTQQWHAHGGAVDSALQQYGKPLVESLLRAAADSAPQALVRNVGGVLFALVAWAGAGAGRLDVLQAWLVEALSAPDFPGVLDGTLTDVDKGRFCQCVLRRPSLPRGRFEAMVVDFGAVCRREGTIDALLMYQGDESPGTRSRE